jgi:hypothetical protein
MYFNSAVEINRLNVLNHKTQLKTSTAQSTYGTKRPRQTAYHCVLLTSALIAVPQLRAEFGENNQKRQYTYKHVSVRPHGTTRLPLDGFSLNLLFEYLFENLSRKSKFHYNLTRITGTRLMCIYDISPNSS